MPKLNRVQARNRQEPRDGQGKEPALFFAKLRTQIAIASKRGVRKSLRSYKGQLPKPVIKNSIVLFKKGETMKALITVGLLLGAQAFAGGIQGNGIITPQIQAILLSRAKAEILTKATGNAALADKLASGNVTATDLRKASLSGKVDNLTAKMGNSPSANRVLVADVLAEALSLPSQLSQDLVGAAKTQSMSADFLTDVEFARIYKPVARPQQIKLGKATVAGSLCSAELTNVFVDQKSQLIHVVVSAGLVVDPTTRPFERGTCLLAVPVSKLVGKGIVFNSVDAYGVAGKQGSAKLQLGMEVFVAGAAGNSTPILLLPENSSTVAKRFAVGKRSNTAYATNESSAILRLNLSATAQRTSPAAIGIIALDRITIKYSLR